MRFDDCKKHNDGDKFALQQGEGREGVWGRVKKELWLHTEDKPDSTPVGFPAQGKWISERMAHRTETGSHIFLLLFNIKTTHRTEDDLSFCMFVCKLVALKHWHYPIIKCDENNDAPPPKIYVKVPTNRLSVIEKWEMAHNGNKSKRSNASQNSNLWAWKCSHFNGTNKCPWLKSVPKIIAPKLIVQTFTFIKTWMKIFNLDYYSEFGILIESLQKICTSLGCIYILCFQF